MLDVRLFQSIHNNTGMKTCQAYQGCPTCTHSWSEPLNRGCVCDGFRVFLPPGDSGRDQRVQYNGHLYEYKGREDRAVPRGRDDDFVKSVLSIASETNPVLAHKTPALIESWPDFDWFRFLCTVEAMHDFKNFAERFVRLLVGKVSNTGYSSWSKDQMHREQCKKLGIFRELWPENGGPLPWRLTKPQRLMLNERMRNVSWPHYLEPLYFRGCSFWMKPGRMWKARRKYRLVLHILPTQLRDQLPRLRDAFFLFIYCMRRLMGQVSSYEEATTMLGILPGSK